MFLEELGIGESGLDRLIHASYQPAGADFLPDGGRGRSAGRGPLPGARKRRRRRARSTRTLNGASSARRWWPIDDLRTLGSMNACKEKGLVRSEGKDYVMKDGDIVLFRFNV